MDYTYELEARALPESDYRIFNNFEEATDFAFSVAIDHNIPLTAVNERVPQARIAAGCSTSGEIWLPRTPFGRSIITILHELAHVASPNTSHGTEWFYWFSFLLRHEVSITAETALFYEIGQT